MNAQVNLGRRRSYGGNLAEFAPVLMILFIFILLPMIAIISYLEGIAAVAYLTHVAVRQAATAGTASQAVATMENIRAQLLGTNNDTFLASFAGLRATAGNGLTLQVIQTENTTGATTTKTVPLGGAPPADPTTDPLTNGNFLFQYQCDANFTSHPLFTPLDQLPTCWTATCQVEHPEGLRN